MKKLSLLTDYSHTLANPFSEREISLRKNPFSENSKQLKSQLLRNFTFFISNCLQKQAFDALKQKSQPDG
jgi:hypothetical protein